MVHKNYVVKVHYLVIDLILKILYNIVKNVEYKNGLMINMEMQFRRLDKSKNGYLLLNQIDDFIDHYADISGV